ncbi:YciI family protein [Devosia nitrariae]|uniref:YCII-related domain-containing protein n=1 Tax=Devosia nitrariae TaxID=2071872 RepID=A0ABQ5W862_9HYPH|nr:YciI family protein [Devosia nitrariae]GLQ56073.1 hypothetical protein GCM10010862_33320 [Devosia nitrariae]
MRYLLLIHADESGIKDAPVELTTTMSADYAAFTEAMVKANVLLGGERLRPTAKAATVSRRNGKKVVLDGPYADVKEQLGGYYMIDAESLEDAVEWASRCPAAENGAIEVRPIWELGAARG